jgi:hypothetical protein
LLVVLVLVPLLVKRAVRVAVVVTQTLMLVGREPRVKVITAALQTRLVEMAAAEAAVRVRRAVKEAEQMAALAALVPTLTRTGELIPPCLLQLV